MDVCVWVCVWVAMYKHKCMNVSINDLLQKARSAMALEVNIIFRRVGRKNYSTCWRWISLFMNCICKSQHNRIMHSNWLWSRPFSMHKCCTYTTVQVKSLHTELDDSIVWEFNVYHHTEMVKRSFQTHSLAIPNESGKKRRKSGVNLYVYILNEVNEKSTKNAWLKKEWWVER